MFNQLLFLFIQSFVIVQSLLLELLSKVVSKVNYNHHFKEEDFVQIILSILGQVYEMVGEKLNIITPISGAHL